ncbi:hypothetical protein Pmani_031291 [Petrolisthes manimaculis]|uniref:Uncharacterized protein n=1 Tax=Petrolisthes manimaculis TaxID=1843537 RepID=A0AAE1NVP2_9EUCA|nr:hypothetical protein Pmani_031291 [Petrolisthes manimaculis]
MVTEERVGTGDMNPVISGPHHHLHYSALPAAPTLPILTITTSITLPCLLPPYYQYQPSPPLLLCLPAAPILPISTITTSITLPCLLPP